MKFLKYILILSFYSCTSSACENKNEKHSYSGEIDEPFFNEIDQYDKEFVEREMKKNERNE